MASGGGGDGDRPRTSKSTKSSSKKSRRHDPRSDDIPRGSSSQPQMYYTPHGWANVPFGTGDPTVFTGRRYHLQASARRAIGAPLLSSGTPSPRDASPHLSGLRLRDTSSVSDGHTHTPLLLNQCYAPSGLRSGSSSGVGSAASPAPAPAPAQDDPDAHMIGLVPGDRDKYGRWYIEPVGISWYPSKRAKHPLMESVRRFYSEPFHSWTEIPNRIRQAMLDEFMTMRTWKQEHNSVIANTFHTKASARLSGWLKRVRDPGNYGNCLTSDVYDKLCIYWNSDEYKALCAKNKKVRNSQTGGSLHTGGAKSIVDISREIEQSLGRPPNQYEVFRRTHIKKKTTKSDPDVWVEQRAENSMDKYSRLLHEFGSNQPTSEEAVHIWSEKVVGGRQKGKVYGRGSLDGVRRIQAGLEGIGSSSQAEAIDGVQIAAM